MENRNSLIGVQVHTAGLKLILLYHRPLPRPSRRIDKHVTRKALLIGVSYTLEEFASGKDDQMEGTHTGVDKFRDLLMSMPQPNTEMMWSNAPFADTVYFDKDDIVIMTDTLETSPHLWPTKANIARL